MYNTFMLEGRIPQAVKQTLETPIKFLNNLPPSVKASVKVAASSLPLFAVSAGPSTSESMTYFIYGGLLISIGLLGVASFLKYRR